MDQTKVRFSDAPWFTEVRKHKVIIGGAGGIGSWLALYLCRMGTEIHIYDFDNVEEVNMAGQLFTGDNIGQSKVNAVFNTVYQLTPSARGRFSIYTNNREIDRGFVSLPVSFSAFDNMRARKNLFDGWIRALRNTEDTEDRKHARIFIDGRLLAEQFQVFFVTPDKIDRYKEYLFDDSEVANESCTFKSTSHFAAGIGYQMAKGYTNYLTNLALGIDLREVPFMYTEEGSSFTNSIEF